MQVSKAKGIRKDKKGAWGMPVALGGDEGRDKLRKAAVRGKYPLTRGYPNGETRRERSRHGGQAVERTRGTETSKYPEEKKSNEMPKVVASEIGRGQTSGRNTGGVVRRQGPETVGEAAGKPHRRV